MVTLVKIYKVLIHFNFENISFVPSILLGRGSNILFMNATAIQICYDSLSLSNSFEHETRSCAKKNILSLLVTNQLQYLTKSFALQINASPQYFIVHYFVQDSSLQLFKIEMVKYYSV